MDRIELYLKSTKLRTNLGVDEKSPIDIFALAQQIEDLSLVFHPLSDHISGICIKQSKASIIAINSTMTEGRQRFTLAHEFYHLYYDERGAGMTLCPKTIGEGKKVEQEADQFASLLLMPLTSLHDEINRVKGIQNGILTMEGVVRLEQYFRVSRHALLVRLMEEGEISKNTIDGYKKNVVSSARRLGFDDSLYVPSSNDKQMATYGKYIKQAEELLSKGVISTGKYEQLLIEANRPDLVYGTTHDGGELFD